MKLSEILTSKWMIRRLSHNKPNWIKGGDLVKLLHNTSFYPKDTVLRVIDTDSLGQIHVNNGSYVHYRFEKV